MLLTRAARGWRAILLAGIVVAASACDEAEPPPHLRVAGGDPERGVTAIERYGCGGCHTIPGVPRARGTVGPPLTVFAARGYVAGVVPNWPRHLVRWIMDPPSISPETAMPALGVNEQEARDIAAYLYSLGAERAEVYPPAPQPPLAPRGELTVLQAEEERRLEDYGWAGDDQVRVPIERAMELLLERDAEGRPDQ